MKVEQLMTRTVESCRSTDSVNAAAQIMWETDCGCVPVVRGDGDGARVVGMLTDRDVCMAAYTQGKPLAAIGVETAMSRQVCSCRPTDDLAVALNILRTNQLHRLPVMDADERLVGMLSLTDIGREADRERGGKAIEVRDADVARAIEAISRPRSPRALVRAA